MAVAQSVNMNRQIKLLVYVTAVSLYTEKREATQQESGATAETGNASVFHLMYSWLL